MKTTKETNIIFWGTPELCLPYLNTLTEAGYTIQAIVTASDRPVGRKQILTPPATKVWGLNHNIQVLQPEKLDEAFQQELAIFQPDVSIVVAYGKIIPQTIIDTPLHGTLNIHYSLLPRWRGASPVEAAILAGDDTTGVSIQKMKYELDAGDVVAESVLELQGNETSTKLKKVLTQKGAELLKETLPNYLETNIQPKPQDPIEVSKCGIISKSDGEISLGESPILLWRKYRAYQPWPGIFFFDDSGKRIKITQARFEQGEFIIEKIIPEGKKEIEWKHHKQ
jgi:methionyl-tRNA formyltransferase